MVSAGALFGLTGSGIAFALDQSKLPQGANHQKAQAKATGAGVRLGIIEAPDEHGNVGIRAANNLGARLIGQRDFQGKNPGDAPGAIAAGANHHSTLVADTAAGSNFIGYLGVASGANVYYGAIDSDNSLRAATDHMRRNDRVSLFNMSLGFGPDTNGANALALYSDWFMRSNDALFVKSAGNRGVDGNAPEDNRITIPGDFYNGITVGASTANFRARANYSSYWLSGDDGTAPDVRGKPDILAPGTFIADGKSYPNVGDCEAGVAFECSGTSFAAPHVTGVAAMLMERGLDLPGPAARNHQAIKSIILNSARKRGINPPENSVRVSLDDGGSANEASDADYLAGLGLKAPDIPVGTLRVGGTATAPKTAEWTPTDWTYDGRVLRVDNPLDDEQGAGMLDAERAMIQYDGGEQEERADNPAGVRPIGWNRDDAGGGANDSYFLNFAMAARTFITATLVWDRPVLEWDRGTSPCDADLGPLPAGCGVVDTADTYVAGVLPDFDLSVYHRGMLIATSNSGGVDAENVEHLHFPVPFFGSPLDYEIRVEYLGAALVDYALSWWTVVPAPGTLLLLLAALPCLAARRLTARAGPAAAWTGPVAA